MSVDYFVYLKSDEPEVPEFEKYAASLGFKISVHPECDLSSHAGFLPFSLSYNKFEDENVHGAFLTGFEFYRDEYLPQKKTQTKPKSFISLFRKKQKMQETPFDSAVKDSSYVLTLACGTSDSFEILVAYIFGAYCVRKCNAVFDDPQFGCFFNDPVQIEEEVYKIVEELCDEKSKGNLAAHKFEGWL